MKRVHIIIEGRVQGVCFRAYARDKANTLGLKGWVKNLYSGNEVEIVAEGDDKKIKEFVDWCRQGPSGANVNNVKIEDEESTDEFEKFMIKF